MRYPARFEASEQGGYVVTFRDIPEAITQVDDLEEAMEMARDALKTAMEFYFEDERPVPPPSKREDGEDFVSLTASVWTKVLLLNSMIEGRIKKADLARRMDAKPQEITRLVNLDHMTKIDELQRAIESTGKQLEIKLI